MAKTTATTNIKQSTAAYEHWLRSQLRGEIIPKDVAAKHVRMAEGPFPFLRATYWRWSEIIFDVCPDLAKAPAVLAVGDIHLENFGTWRDVEGRLVWGINDFDEAAEMPYAIDLVRLAASALLARDAHRVASRDVCASILEGYARGLAAPGPIVLDGTYGWLRRTLALGDKQRARHQAGLKPKKTGHPPRRYVEALHSVLPEGAIELAYGPRTAGTGSLGRPRWIGYAEWRGGSLVREAKAIVPSAWTLPAGRPRQPLRCGELARGRFRSPDPWYVLVGSIVVRRLSPSNRKIEIDDPVFVTHGSDLLAAMGHELATVHLGVTDRRKSILRDLQSRRRRWLREAAEAAADAVAREQRIWAKLMAKKRR